MKQERKQYYIVDAVKFIMCIFIIALHCRVHMMFTMSYWIEKSLFRLAVPFFFITSGFLLGEKINSENNIIEIKIYFIKYSKRLLQLLIIFEPISVLLNIGVLYYEGNQWHKIFLLVVRDIIFYPRGALWFIQACIVGVWVIYFLFKYKLKKWIPFIAVLFYLFALICNSYYFIVSGTKLEAVLDLYLKITASARNGIFVGFPYLYVGILINSFIKNANRKILGGITVCIIPAYIIYLLEVYFLQNKTSKDDGSLFISLPLFTILLLLVCLQYNTYEINSKFILFRNLSTGMYLLHSPVLTILGYGSKVLFHIEMNAILKFILTVFITFLICIASYQSKSKFIKNLLK